MHEDFLHARNKVEVREVAVDCDSGSICVGQIISPVATQYLEVDLIGDKKEPVEACAEAESSFLAGQSFSSTDTIFSIDGKSHFEGAIPENSNNAVSTVEVLNFSLFFTSLAPEVFDSSAKVW
jgi:hypothetical protein